MSPLITSVRFRAASAGELDLVLSFPDKPASDVAADWASGHRRPEWCRLAFSRGRRRPLARALWWGAPGAAYPLLLDTLTVDVPDPAERRSVGAALISEGLAALTPPGGRRPGAQLTLPAGWRDHPDVRAAADDWIAMTAAAGLEPASERTGFVRSLWPAGPVLPTVPDGTEFHPADLEALLPLARRVLGPEAPDRIAEARDLGSPAAWWRLLPDRGFVLPGRTQEGLGFVGLLAVLPGHESDADGLLAEGLRVLASAGVRRVRADAEASDAAAGAFRRAGFAIAYSRLNSR